MKKKYLILTSSLLAISMIFGIWYQTKDKIIKLNPEAPEENYQEKETPKKEVESKPEEETPNEPVTDPLPTRKEKEEVKPNPSEKIEDKTLTPTIETPKESPEKENVKPTEKPSESVKPEEKPNEPVVSSQEELNDQKRKELQNRYDVKIQYGLEFSNYRPRGYTPNYMTDPNRIKEYLNRLGNAMALYPSSFFQEFQKEGMPLTIYLIESVPGNAFTGLTDKEFYDDIKLTLTTTGFFERVFHHEMMHYIDAYMEIILYPNSPYQGWEELNPTDFHYGVTNSSYTYHMIDRPRGMYFINNYGQTNIREDRATIFEDMMSRAYAPTGCYENGEVINRKGRLISEMMEKAFSSVSPNRTERWERFLY